MKKHFLKPDILILLLAAACVAMGAALCVADIRLLPVVILVLAVLTLVCVLNARSVHTAVATLLHGAAFTRGTDNKGLANLNVPMLVTAGKNIVWYNDSFSNTFLEGGDACLLPVKDMFHTFDTARIAEDCGMNMAYGGHEYTVYGGKADGANDLFVACFVENSVLKQHSREYLASRPCVLMITVDTYNEILRDMKDSDRARIAGDIDLALEKFIGSTTGFVRRTGASTYVAVVEERHMEKMIETRFSVLDAVRSIGDENTIVTLSIGVGHGGHTLLECEQMALQALDMALGRGGDQAAVKTPDGFTFFGGVSRSVEKRSKVKSRIIANALVELVKQADSVLIMGHKLSDLDAVGAAIGVLRVCKLHGKPSAIVVRSKRTLATPLIDQFCAAGLADDFIEPEEALDGITAKTLLVVVDAHIKAIVESEEVYKRCQTVVVIDHHRKSVGHIDNANLFYHEPYASSTCELVSELLQHIGDKDEKPTPLEAQALLAGIVLDTREFSLHAGVRTFEAAAYLRRLGAQTQEVKKLFASSFESYAYKAQLVTDAEIYLGCAVVFAHDIPAEMNVVAPQAANDLLSIEGVQASFVAVENNGFISMSARSMGEVNVQVIMEALGGGGHLTMAGAQFRDQSEEDIKKQLLNAIAEYRENQRKQQQAKR